MIEDRPNRLVLVDRLAEVKAARRADEEEAEPVQLVFDSHDQATIRKGAPMLSYLSLNPYAVTALALLACSVVATTPFWKRRARRRSFVTARHARIREDLAWRHRAEEAELARRLRFARYDQEQALGGHSLRVIDDA